MVKSTEGTLYGPLVLNNEVGGWRERLPQNSSVLSDPWVLRDARKVGHFPEISNGTFSTTAFVTTCSGPSEILSLLLASSGPVCAPTGYRPWRQYCLPPPTDRRRACQEMRAINQPIRSVTRHMRYLADSVGESTQPSSSPCITTISQQADG